MAMEINSNLSPMPLILQSICLSIRVKRSWIFAQTRTGFSAKDDMASSRSWSLPWILSIQPNSCQASRIFCLTRNTWLPISGPWESKLMPFFLNYLILNNSFSPSGRSNESQLPSVPQQFASMLESTILKLVGLDLIPKDLVGSNFVTKLRVKFSNASTNKKVRKSLSLYIYI